MGYLKIFLPSWLGSALFAANGFIDNFMVGHIAQGVTALSAINSWTNIILGFSSGTMAASSVVLARLYHLEKYDLVKEIARLRNLVCLGFSTFFAIVSWIFPYQLISVFLESNSLSSGAIDPAYLQARQEAYDYMQIIAISWILLSLSFAIGTQLRELGHGKITAIWGIGTLAIHIALNALFMYGFGWGVKSAAGASVIARCFTISVGWSYARAKKLPIIFLPWTIFKISKGVWLQFLQKWFLFVSFTSLVFFVTFRNFFYDKGYPALVDSPLGGGIGAMMILGLTGAIANVFINTFNVLPSLSSYFVASFIAKGNYEQARTNSNELRGFTTTVCAGFSLMLLIIALCVPFMGFLANGVATSYPLDNTRFLKHVSHSLIVICIFYPIWIWTMTTMRNSVIVGHKGLRFSIADWIIAGPIQLSWLSIIVFLIMPHVPLLQENFSLSYAMFYLADLIKMVTFEILYHKVEWKKDEPKRFKLIKQNIN